MAGDVRRRARQASGEGRTRGAAVARILLLLGVLVLVVVVALGGAAYLLGGSPGSGEAVDIEVAEGATAAQVAAQLDERGVVRSALAFRLKARSRGLDRRLLAGTYQLETGMSVDEAIDGLLAGPSSPASVRFTIPEGLTVAETLERLDQATSFAADEYRAVLDGGELRLPEWVPPADSLPAGVREPHEGLLFPETYEFPRSGATPEVILQRMVDQLAEVVASLPDEQVAAAAARGLDRYEVLTMASLVEKEVRVAEERPIVASVITNRLEAGRALQIDFANIYAANVDPGRVTEDLLAIDSPYNLYQHVGLPPTPIAAPGRAAIAAALQPAETEFLYYVKKDEEGRHAFAETFEEHQANVERFRELQRDAEESSPTPTAP